ncbi:hypothetical protein PRNP1_010043 [Phytophthora ramorum]
MSVLSSFSKVRDRKKSKTTTAYKMTCRGTNRAGKRCGTRYGLNEEGYCNWHGPNVVKCRGIRKNSVERCKISVGLNARGFCRYHKKQDTADPNLVDAPYAHQCLGTASSTGSRCLKDWEVCPNGYCIYHQTQVKPPQSQASREYVERVRAGWAAQEERRTTRRSFR